MRNSGDNTGPRCIRTRLLSSRKDRIALGFGLPLEPVFFRVGLLVPNPTTSSNVCRTCVQHFTQP